MAGIPVMQEAGSYLASRLREIGPRVLPYRETTAAPQSRPFILPRGKPLPSFPFWGCFILFCLLFLFSFLPPICGGPLSCSWRKGMALRSSPLKSPRKKEIGKKTHKKNKQKKRVLSNFRFQGSLVRLPGCFKIFSFQKKGWGRKDCPIVFMGTLF